MTLEELRAEAKKYGYGLYKIGAQKPKLSPCTCGRKHVDLWHEARYIKDNKGIERKRWGYFVQCPNCGRKSEWSINEIGARNNWNKIIEGSDTNG